METVDYLVLFFLLVGTSAYGILRSCTLRLQSAREVLVGSKVSSFYVALSVCSGFISSISLLGFPAEVYHQGPMILWYGPVYFICFPLVAFVFLPTIYELKLTSLYQYFELRFNLTARCTAAFIFCTQTLLYNAVALYAPSLALSSFLELPIFVSIVMTASFSAVYISIGGARAGIHTQAIQMLLIIVAMSFIIVVGMWNKSFGDVIATAKHGGRLSIGDFRLDPRIRHSVWSILIGGTGNCLALFAANQLSIQKYMAMPNLKGAQRVVMGNIPCNLCILFIYAFIGLIIYATYAGCHPALSATDRLLPHYVIDQLSGIPGVTGLFLAAVFSAGISTLSSAFSALSAVVYEDIVKKIRLQNDIDEMSEGNVKSLLWGMPLFFAAVSIGLAVLCHSLGAMILQVAFTVFGALGGPVLGMFIVGMFFKNIHGKAATTGLIVSTIVTLTLGFGAFMLQIRPIRLPLDSSCPKTDFLHSTISYPRCYGYTTPCEEDTPFYVEIFRVSYQYYSVIGVIANVFVSWAVQKCFGRWLRDSRIVPNRFLSPYVRSANLDIDLHAEEFAEKKSLTAEETC